MVTIKSINPVQHNGGEWVVRARLSDGTERCKGIGSRYTMHQAEACATAPGSPRAGHPASALDEDREPNMAAGGSSEGMPSCWVESADSFSAKSR